MREGRHTGFHRSLDMKHGQQVAVVGVPPLPQKEARLQCAGFFVFWDRNRLRARPSGTALPFLIEPPQELFHEPVALFGNRPAGRRVHAVLQQQQFLVEVVVVVPPFRYASAVRCSVGLIVGS